MVKLVENKLILEPGEFLTKPCFIAHFKVHYGEQSRYETEHLSATSKDEAEREALIFELQSNSDKFVFKEEVLNRLTSEELKTLCERHKEDRCECEIWDFHGVDEEEILVSVSATPIELTIKRRGGH